MFARVKGPNRQEFLPASYGNGHGRR
jgi:hypothetical protein